MKPVRLRKALRPIVLWSLAAFFAWTSTGHATVAVIDCSSNSAALVNLAGSGPLNGNYAIKGICAGDATILNSDAVIQPDAGGGSIAGSLLVKQSNLVLNSLTLNGGNAGSFSGIVIGDFGPGGSGMKPSTVSLVDTTVEGYTQPGVTVSNGTLLTSSAFITQNVGGVCARHGARVELTNSTSISNNIGNAACRGAVHAENGATVVATGSSVDGNPPLWLSQATADIEMTFLTSPIPTAFPAIFAQSGTLNLVSASVFGGIFADSGSRITARATDIEQSTILVPAIFAADGSQFVSLGGNTISNSVSGAVALTLQNGSIYRQRNESMLLIQPLQADHITGSALVQVQSGLEIGAGLISGSPSVTWSVPANSCILIQQNSSIRLSGGVEIDGAPPSPCALNGGAVTSSIVIQQESNGFFNLSQGGTDFFTGGGSVSCVFAGMPNAHVTGKANITPAGAQPVVIGSLSQALTATSPGCLGP